jgi:outer membrane protein insertion porin family
VRRFPLLTRSLAGAFLLGLVLAGPALAQPEPVTGVPASPIVGRVRVAGNVTADSIRIIRSFELGVGQRYTDEAARRGIRKLFALGLFTDVWVEKLEHDGQVELVIHVTERPRIGRIEFAGNRRYETGELRKKLFLRVGEAYSPTAAQTQVDSLLRFYHEEGYAQAGIEAQADSVSANQIALRFVIREGEKVKIRSIRIEGATAFSQKRLRKQLTSKAKGLIGGGQVKPENEEKDRADLEAFYHNHGYRDARVTSYRLEPGTDPRRLTLVVGVEEGRRYWFGKFAWAGQTLLSAREVETLPRLKSGDLYDLSKLEKAQRGAAELYQEKGYLYLNVEPEEDVRDSVVDVTLRITEGKPSRVRFVHVTGNVATREKVIRRELEIHEGDLFKRSALVRSQGDVFRLGIFEDVQIDFTPAESTDVDVSLKVKEKQVGTASAGAGYTSETGLTGFVQLGHNNVLGNGQSLQVTLERGPKRSNYLLSFTEPWFRDTPTLLGLEVFNTRQELDLYTEKRVGGSARMGRPLPWPDYSRGFVTYRLEDVEIDELEGAVTAGTFTLTDSSFLNRKVRTSSLELAFLRNSADNPFYPTKGSRLSTSHELAGGIFGGVVDFNKHRLEGRVYLPSLLKGVTTMVRGRFGVLAGYGGNEAVPSYERFRLGGGNVMDPLRGYDDYQVVPPENIRLDSTLVKSYVRDSLGAVVDSTLGYRVIKVRYPGGRWMATFTVEQQFPIVHPLHGVLFFDAGNTWNDWRDIRPFDLKMGAGIGFRLEIPLLGTIGVDWGYGFNRDDGARFKGHFLLGQGTF